MSKRASPSRKRHIVAEFHRRLKRGRKSKTYIYEDLAGYYGWSSKTIQRWVTRADKETKPMTADLTKRLEHVEEGLGMVASGNYCVDEDMISQDGRLLV